MSNLTGKQRSESVRRMFARIAKRYDTANRWMTWGQDVKWRKKVITLAAIPKFGRLLDIGTGTGDLALAATRRDPSVLAIGADLTLEMLLEGLQRPGSKSVRWTSANALELPFNSETFEAVVSGYLLRNVADINQALLEQFRVLKWGGRMVSLDTTPLPGDIWHLPARLYVRKVIPLIGQFIAGDRQAYEYLPTSTERFLTAQELVYRMETAGFKNVKYQLLMGDTMAIHWGDK